MNITPDMPYVAAMGFPLPLCSYTHGPELDIIEPATVGIITEPLDNRAWWVMLMSGTLAGCMLGLLSWLVTAYQDTISQIFIVWLVITAIGLSQLHYRAIHHVTKTPQASSHTRHINKVV